MPKAREGTEMQSNSIFNPWPGLYCHERELHVLVWLWHSIHPWYNKILPIDGCEDKSENEDQWKWNQGFYDGVPQFLKKRKMTKLSLSVMKYCQIPFDFLFLHCELGSSFSAAT